MIYLISVIISSMLISAACSLFEACILSISNSDIAAMAPKKPKLAEVWKTLKGNIQKPIAVILIINTIAHTIGASLSGAQFDELYGPKWIILFSLVFSFAMIQWTEILPKALGVKFNRNIAIIGTYPLLILIKIFTPFIKFVELLNYPFIGKYKEEEKYDTIQEISVLSRFASINNLISQDQAKIISRTIGLKDKKAKDIMIPKKELKILTDNMTLMEALIESHIHNHTRYPLVSSENINNVLGYINFKDIVSALQINPSNPSLKGILRPIPVLRDEDGFQTVFKRLTLNHQHIAVVKNDSEELAGLITIEDVIEELVGEIEDEYDILPSHIYPISLNRFIAGGGVSIRQINEFLGTDIPEPDAQLNDWIKNRFGSEQKPGNNFKFDGVVFVIKKISRLKINEVLIEKLT